MARDPALGFPSPGAGCVPHCRSAVARSATAPHRSAHINHATGRAFGDTVALWFCAPVVGGITPPERAIRATSFKSDARPSNAS